MSDSDIESMIKYLCSTANHFTISTFDGGVDVYAAWMGATKNGRALRIGEGVTLGEALASACEYMKGRPPHADR